MITLCGQITSFYNQVNFDADLKINLLISLIDAREAIQFKFNYHLSPVTGGITLTGIHIFLVLDTQEKCSLVKAGSVNHNMAMYSTEWNNSQHSGK